MSGFGFGLIFGLVIAVAFGILWRRGRKGKAPRETRVSIDRQIKQMQSIGELSVFRAGEALQRGFRIEVRADTMLECDSACHVGSQACRETLVCGLEILSAK